MDGPAHADEGRPLCPPALATHRRIVVLLREMAALRCSSALEPAFRSRWERLLALFGRFQEQTAAASGRRVTCRQGCCHCCLHWVEDVSSFEAEYIAEAVRRDLAASVPAMLAACRADIVQMERLERLSGEKLARARRDLSAGEVQLEQVDLMLAGFHRLRRPCPLLGPGGACLLYRLRPLTCRIYVSFSPAECCDPSWTGDGGVPTCLINLDEEASGILDELHLRYDRSGGDTGLRSLLVKLLAGPRAGEG